jgi:ABC-2 type transport system ATP-binding protein
MDLTMLAIETDSLTKKFSNITAVDKLSFSVEEGEIFGLLGPNGAGKTTTIRMLACVISPTSGTANVGGHDLLKEPQQIRRNVGILTENPSLYEKMTAVENIDFFARAYGMRDQVAISDRIKELLEFFQLWDRRRERVAVYSKGMKQKLAIARALVHDPPLLFLDEPTSGLDPESSKLIRDLVEKLGRYERRTILLSTHRLEDAQKLCNRVMIINRGSSKVIGTVNELRSRMAGHPKLEIVMTKIAPEGVVKVRSIKSVESVEVDDVTGRMVVEAEGVQAVAPYIVKVLVDSGSMIVDVHTVLPSLEDAYLALVNGGIKV